MLIDIATFRLVAGADEDAFLEADEAVRTGFLYHQPGLVRSTTARGADGEWAVINVWDAEEDADRAAEAARTDPANARVRSLVDEETFHRRRYETLD